MTGLLRRATLYTALGLLAAGAASAAVPSASNSTLPNGFNLVAHTGGVADPAVLGGSTFTIRDGANNPVPNSVVIANFSTCTDLRGCPGTQGAGMTVNCGAKTVSGTTDAAGVVVFRIVGGGFTTGAAITAACVGITADGVPMGTLRGSAFDVNGLGGVTTADITLAKSIFSNTPTRTICDYNKSGSVTTADITLIKANFSAAGNEASCSAYCVGWW